MAQCVILLMFRSSRFRGVDFRIESKADNQASEAIIAQGNSHKLIALQPYFGQFRGLSYQTQIQLEPYRCSSADNSRADDLSRGRLFPRNFDM